MEKWASFSKESSAVFTSALPGDEILQKISRNARILDVGCGYGRCLRYLAKKGFSFLSGTDISSDLIAEAKKNVPAADLEVADVEGDFMENREFEFIIIMGVIEYLLNDDAQKVFFKKISDKLSPDGHIYLSTFVIDNEVYLKQYLCGFLRTFHWGRFINKKGYECHHQDINKIAETIRSEFNIIFETREKIRTWTGKPSNGYMVFAQKKA